MRASFARLVVCGLLALVGLAGYVGSVSLLTFAQGEAQTERSAPHSPGRPTVKYPIRYQPPDERLLHQLARQQVGAQATPGDLDRAKRDILREWAKTHAQGPDPAEYQKRLRAEKLAQQSGRSVAELGLAVTGTFRLLAIAVEFAGEDTAENFSHPRSTSDSTCITETVTYAGPLHGQIPGPGPRDNHTFWLPNFDSAYYNKVLLSTEGITERIRLDLTDPEDGLPGINIRGQTVKRYFETVSGGLIRLDGGPRGVIAWVQLPHSEGYYGASACIGGSAGASGMEGLPSNPRFGFGAPTLIEDAVKVIKAHEPNFPWQEYDTNGDNVVDHVVLFHAGKDKSEGGGVQGTQALWAHSATVDEEKGGYPVDDRGTTDPTDDIKITAYTLHPEDAAPGVIIHELGHALGLPDLYDTTYQGDTSVAVWDVMGYGLFSGKLFETHPVQMSAWSRVALGWTTPLVITPTAEATEVTLGQAFNQPAGSTQVVQVNLPPARLDYVFLQPGSTQAWWTSSDQNWADVRLTRDVDLRDVTGPVSFTFQTNYTIEKDWDFMFVEVSVDAGQTYTQTKGFRVGTTQEVTTGDTYGDPYGTLRSFGGLRYGYTGASNGWRAVYHNLTPYAGRQIKLRVHYATDIGTLKTGAFLDNFRILAGSRTILDDPVEGNALAGWTPTVHSFSPRAALGEGWQLSDGGDTGPRYYLLEWRNTTGFDQGLQYIYNSIFYVLNTEGKPEWTVDWVRANVPGMLVWLRDGRFGQALQSATQEHMSELHFFATPSEGPKAGVLLVDANPDPLRMNINWLLGTGYGWFPFPAYSNWPTNVQASNGAFSLLSTPPLTLTYDMTQGGDPGDLRVTQHAPKPPAPGFHDALGYYPGVEAVPTPIVTYSDTTTLRSQPYALALPDASAVIPAKGYYPPRTPPGFTGRGGEPGSPLSANETFYFLGGQFADLDIGRAGLTHVSGQHSGHPGDDQLHYGHHFKVVSQATNGASGVIRLWNRAEAAEVRGQARLNEAFPGIIDVEASLVNTGGAATIRLVSRFDPTIVTYIEGSATPGVTELRDMPGGPVVGFSRAAPVGSGASLSLTYRVRTTTYGATLLVTNHAYGAASSASPLDEQITRFTLPGSRLYLPTILKIFGR